MMRLTVRKSWARSTSSVSRAIRVGLSSMAAAGKAQPRAKIKPPKIARTRIETSRTVLASLAAESTQSIGHIPDLLASAIVGENFARQIQRTADQDTRRGLARMRPRPGLKLQHGVFQVFRRRRPARQPARHRK